MLKMDKRDVRCWSLLLASASWNDAGQLASVNLMYQYGSRNAKIQLHKIERSKNELTLALLKSISHIVSMGDFLTDNYHCEHKWWYNVLSHVAMEYPIPFHWYRTFLNKVDPLA